MRPETLQTLSQILIFIGLMLTAVGGYGHFHYGKKIDKINGLKMDQKIESIPTTISENTDKVLDAIMDVKSSVDTLGVAEGLNISKISYPENGKFGLNILNQTTKFHSGTFSMHVLIPNKQNITVKITGINWTFPAFQSIPGWRHFDYELSENFVSRKFENIKYGNVDLEIWLKAPDTVNIEIFENNSTISTRKKTIIVE